MIFVICGPTGVGKSSLSEAYLKMQPAYIVNGDAFQCYKEMNIGTAKISEELINDGNHFLFNIASVDNEYTIYEYQKDLRNILDKLTKDKTKDILIVGGSGLYLKSALYDFSFSENKKVDLSEFEKMSDEELHGYLKTIDLQQAAKIHFHNRKRVLRAIEIYLVNGENKTSLESRQEHKLLYDVHFIGLSKDSREELYKLIDERVDQMFKDGLVEEVKNLIKSHNPSLRAFQAIGYKELISYFEGKISLDEAKELIKKNSRHYAKRQYTYFNHQMDVRWFNSPQEALQYMKEVKGNETI